MPCMGDIMKKMEIVDVQEIDAAAIQTRWNNGCIVTSFVIEDQYATVHIIEVGGEWFTYIEEDETE